MEVNAQQVKDLRQERSWTQQHLADACGVSLRTIQRIERYGTTSNETFMGLCSVFDVAPQQLKNAEPTIVEVAEPPTEKSQVHIMMALSALGGAVFGIVMTLLLVSSNS